MSQGDADRRRITIGPGAIGAAIALVLWSGILLGPGLVGSIVPTDTGRSSPTPATSPDPSGSPVDTVDRRSLGAILVINGRLIDARDALEVETGATPANAVAISATMRDMNVQLGVGLGLANQLTRDPVTVALGVDLGAVYRSALDTSRATLGISVQDETAYAAGATAIVTALAGLEELDARASALIETGEDPAATAIPGASGSPVATPSIPSSPSPAASPGASAAPSGASPLPRPGNLLVDPGLEIVADPPWTLAVDAGASATIERDPAVSSEGSSSARIDIARSSEARTAISLEQAGLTFEAGRRYGVSLKLRASAPREARVRISAADGQTLGTRLLDVGTAWEVYQFEFTALVAAVDARLAIDLGRTTPTTWVDDAFVGPVREIP